MTHKQGFRIRIYPNKEQTTLLWKHVGCCRWLWNQMIDIYEYNYSIGGKFISNFDMINMVPYFKSEEEYEWLKEVSSQSLNIICSDLATAYDRFYKGISNLPKYKSRQKSKPSFPARSNEFYLIDKKTLHIEKIGALRYKTDRRLPIGRKSCKFWNVRVIYDNGKWFVGFVIEREDIAPTLTENLMGIDLGIKELAVVANGESDEGHLVFPNINKSKQIRDLKSKIVHTQRTISRKYEANKQGNKYVKTKNIEKEEAKLRRLWRRIANIRDNYINQITHKLVELHPKRVVMEDLNIKGMMKNKHLAKPIGEMCWYEFRRQMQYKCEWNGIEFVLADRWYPSSKICSGCGNKLKTLKLSDRTYVCPVCGLTIDRDYNAAINLSRYEEHEEASQS